MAQSFDDQLKQTVASVAERLHLEVDREVAAAAEHLGALFQAERAETVAAAVRDAVGAAERELADRVRADAEARDAAHAADARARDDAHAAALDEVRRGLSADLEAARQAHDEALALARQASAAALAAVEQSRADLEARLQDYEAAQPHREEQVRADAYAAGLEAGNQQARADLETRLRAQDAAFAEREAHTRQQAFEAGVASAEARASQASGEAMQHITELVDAVRALDGATSLSQALDILGSALGRQADRSALFLVRDSVLRTWTRHGFDSHHGAQPIELALGAAGIAAQAVSERSLQYADAARLASHDVVRPALALLDACGAVVAAPVLIHGKPIAVLYAEMERAPAQPRLPLSCELLARHAGRLLESITVARLSQLGAAPGSDPAAVGGLA